MQLTDEQERVRRINTLDTPPTFTGNPAFIGWLACEYFARMVVG
jgi:hypothetical protein